MEIEKIKTLLNGLNVNDSISILSDKSYINGVINVLDHNFKVMTISKGIYSVARIADTKHKKTIDLLKSIDKLNYFNTIPIDGDIAYIRSLVSKYNLTNGTKIKVRKQDQNAVIYKNVREIEKPITRIEMNEIKSDLNEILFQLFDGVNLGDQNPEDVL